MSMETLKTSPHPAECPLRNPLTTQPKPCASCIGAHSPAQHWVASNHTLAKLLRRPLLRAIFDCAWGTLHWNAHYIASTRKPWKQPQQPGPMPLHFRVSYFTLSTAIAVLATFCFGIAVAQAHGATPAWQGGLAMLLIAGPGWGLQAMLALSVKGMQSLEYLSHLATVMWKGVLPLAVASAVAFVVGSLPAAWFIAAVTMSSLWMAIAHFRRVHALGHSQAWTLTWLLLLHATAWTALGYVPFAQSMLNWQ